MVDGGGPITSVATAKPLSQNAQPLQAPQISSKDSKGINKDLFLLMVASAQHNSTGYKKQFSKQKKEATGCLYSLIFQ